MKVNSINSIQQNKQNFGSNPGKLLGGLGKAKDGIINSAVNLISDHPKAIAALAGSSVVAQKVIMGGSEAAIGPVMDVAIGKTITKATGEKDGRTNESSKTQAIRTCAQSVGGAITGIAIRMACIAASTAAITVCGAKAGEKAAPKLAEIFNPEKYSKTADAYLFNRKISEWGKSVGGAVAIVVMMFTNFLLDVPLVNFLNKKMTGIVNKHQENKTSGVSKKEAE